MLLRPFAQLREKLLKREREREREREATRGKNRPREIYSARSRESMRETRLGIVRIVLAEAIVPILCVQNVREARMNGTKRGSSL